MTLSSSLILPRLWRLMGGPELKTEYRFCPPRRWRFDYAHLPSRIAIEIEGGVYSGGRHTRGRGFIEDCEKYNRAALMGWRVFRVPAHLVGEAWLAAPLAAAKEK